MPQVCFFLLTVYVLKTMPSQIMHVLAASSALLKSSLSDTQTHIGSFNLGAQGPDIFSHNRRTRPFALAYSRLLHRRNYGLFCSHFINQTHGLTGTEGLLCRSWFSGFVTHQVLDRILHPFIIYRSSGVPSPSGFRVNPSRFHAFFERILDVLIFNHHRNLPVSEFDSGKPFFLLQKEIEVLSFHISRGLAATYLDETKEDFQLVNRIHNAFLDSIYFYALTNPSEISLSIYNPLLIEDDPLDRIQRFQSYGLDSLALLHPDLPSSGIDWLNLSHEAWKHPVNGDVFYSSVPELFNVSVEKSVDIFEMLYSLYSVTEIQKTDLLKFEHLIGNTCLGVAGPDGKVGKVMWQDPFPLDSELLFQMNERRKWLEPLIC